MRNHYSIVIRYFLLMFLMLLLTGIWLLLLHASITLESFTSYYVKKTVFGLLEVVSPHLFAMGTSLFILTHFLSLNKKNTTYENKLTLTLFVSMLLSNLSVFFIAEQTSWVIWVKLISTMLFLILSLLIMYQVFFRTYNKLKLINS